MSIPARIAAVSMTSLPVAGKTKGLNRRRFRLLPGVWDFDVTRWSKHAGTNDLQLQSRPAVRHHDGGVGHRRHGGRRADRRATDVSGPDRRRFVAVLRALAAAA